MQQKGLITSISVGVKEGEYAFVETLAREGLVPDYVTIDIAHGHSNAVINMIQHLKIFTRNVRYCGQCWNARSRSRIRKRWSRCHQSGDWTRKVCITKIKTGFGTGGRQLAALRWCAKVARKPIIADGGIRTHGDIAKSVRFGATMVMIGSLFAGHEESPGETKVEDGVVYKEYFGSASEFQKGEKKNVEGKKSGYAIKGSWQIL